MWTVEFDDRARKELRKLDPDTRDRILKWLRTRIANQPDPRHIGKALKGRMTGLRRYRIGTWRIICQLRDEHQRVLVIRVGHRRYGYGWKHSVSPSGPEDFRTRGLSSS